jgi:hypothetical protein
MLLASNTIYELRGLLIHIFISKSNSLSIGSSRIIDMPFGFGKKDAGRRYNKGSTQTDITDTKKLDEIEKVADRLDEDEKVLLVTRQTKNPMKSGGSMFTPNSVIVTDKKLILRNPSALGLRQKLEYYAYDTIVDVKLERGMLSAALEINVPGSVEDARVDAISKDDAEQILRIMQEGIKKAKGNAQGNQTQDSSSIADELAKIAKLKEDGVITDEEFQEMKQKLLSK